MSYFLNKETDNTILVKKASDLSGEIDSTKVYIIDGPIDMGTEQVKVPSSGIFIKGLDYFVSSIFSSEDNHTCFINKTGEAAGNVRIVNTSVYTSGVGSKIFDLDNQGNFGSFELLSCNLGDFSVETTSLGELTGYRQFRTDDFAFIRVGDGLTFSGTWVGGFSITASIALSIPANTVLLKTGTNLLFTGSSVSDMNGVSVDDTVVIADFSDTNFTRDEGFKLNGARFNLNSNPLPNISTNSTKIFFSNCSGVENTYLGANMEFTTQAATNLTTVSTPVKAAGITTTIDLVYFTETASNELRYDSSIAKDFLLSGQIVIDGGPNDEIEVILRKWDDSAGVYLDIKSFKRNISNVLGGLDIAYFDPSAPVRLEINDKVELWVQNNTDNTNVIVLEGSFLRIEKR